MSDDAEAPLNDMPHDVSRSLRCAVEVSGASVSWTAVARAASREGMCVLCPPGEEDKLRLGDVLEVKADAPPLGPLHATARVARIDLKSDPQGRLSRLVQLQFIELNEAQWNALGDRLESIRPLVVTVGLDSPLLENSQSAYRVVEAGRQEDVLRYLEEEAAVLVLGPRLSPVDAHALLAGVSSELPGSANINIVVGTGSKADLFQPLVDDDRVFYLSRGLMSDVQLRSIIAAAARRLHAQATSGDDLAATTAMTGRLLEFSARLVRQPDVAGTGRMLGKAVRSLVGAESVQCLIYDPEKELLSSMEPSLPEARTVSAVAGLVGFVARTGEGLALKRIGTDPRYDPEADNPGRDHDARFMADPIIGIAGVVVGVVTAVRAGRLAPFSVEDAHSMRLIARSVAAPLSAILAKARAEALLDGSLTSRGSAIFRQEALEHHAGTSAQPGELLKTSPRWLRTTPWLVSALLLAGLAFTGVARLREYATGPAVIRARHKFNVPASAPGLVQSVGVLPGDRIRTGDVLVSFHDAQAKAAERPKALRAPGDGLVGEVLVQPGQHVVPGDPLLSIVDERAGYELIALLPGAYASRLKPGMPLVLRIRGYPDVRESLFIEHVGASIVGPHEAARYARRESADALGLPGPVVLVRSSLQPTFTGGDHPYPYQDGMLGDAEVIASTEPMIVIMVPGLKGFLKTIR